MSISTPPNGMVSNTELILRKILGEDVTPLPPNSRVEFYLTQVEEYIERLATGATRPIGETTTALTDGATTNPIVIDGNDYTAQINDIVFYGNKEFLFTVNGWREVGDLTNLNADMIDDTNTTKKFASQAQLDQIGTNQTNILSIPRTTLNRLPYTITANATGNLVEYAIYGNSGGVGIATDNMLNPALFANDKTIGADGIPTTYPEGGRITTTTPVDVSAVNSVTLQYISSVTSTMWIYSLFSEGTLVRRVANNQNNATIDVSGGDSLYICFYGSGTITTDSVTNMMLATSSIPYQPYGKYKIPITVGDTTTNLIVDSPLTTGEIMANTDFNTNIAIATGSNTISTSLTNKPIMYCKYV